MGLAVRDRSTIPLFHGLRIVFDDNETIPAPFGAEEEWILKDSACISNHIQI